MELKSFIKSIGTLPNENIWLVKNRFYDPERHPFEDFYYVVAESNAEGFKVKHDMEKYQFEECYSSKILEEYFGDMVTKMSIDEHRRFLNSIIPRYNEYTTHLKTDGIIIPPVDISAFDLPEEAWAPIDWGLMPQRYRMWTNYEG